MAGGSGDDMYFVDDAGDVVVEVDNGDIDTVWSSIDYTLGADVERLVLTGGARSGTGNDLANRIAGNAGDNTLDGGAGADTLEGGAGNDVYLVGDAGDVIVEAEGGGIDMIRTAAIDYTLGAGVEILVLIGPARSGTGNALDNTIIGNALANTLKGEAGNDTLDGGAGADVLQGGEGNDLYLVDDASDEILEATGDGYDSVQASVDYVLGDNAERLILIGAAIAGTGNAIDNVIVGNVLANSLSGGEGNDTLDGGEGDDTLTGGDGNDSVIGGDGNDSLDGSAGNDSLAGGNGDDTLIGGAGADCLDGGAGDDTYEVDDAGDTVAEDRRRRDRTVLAWITYTLGDWIENLELLGSAALRHRQRVFQPGAPAMTANNTLQATRATIR